MHQSGLTHFSLPRPGSRGALSPGTLFRLSAAPLPVVFTSLCGAMSKFPQSEKDWVALGSSFEKYDAHSVELELPRKEHVKSELFGERIRICDASNGESCRKLGPGKKSPLESGWTFTIAQGREGEMLWRMHLCWHPFPWVVSAFGLADLV